MNSGGRTMWYCPGCGRQMRQGTACQCGSTGGVPSNGPITLDAGGGAGAALKRLVARMTGRG
jgi:hypothetical protein